MKKEEQLRENFINMKMEYRVSHHKICRKIDAIFHNEIEHFSNLLKTFNDDYCCINQDGIDFVSKKLEILFNECKVILVEDYESKFEANVEELSTTMYDFFIRRLTNQHAKCPTAQISRCLTDMCKFDCFLLEDKLENELFNFINDFNYRYINSEDARRDFNYLIKNIRHSLMCELKKAISSSVEDKQDITARYNTLNKEVLNSNPNKR